MSSATDDSVTFSFGQMSTVDMQSKRMSRRKSGAFLCHYILLKLLYTCFPESQNGPCFVCPACSLICIKTQLRTTWRRNRKSSDLGKAVHCAAIG